MGKDHNVYIKLELSRDRNTGILNLITHFDLNAPNVFLDGQIFIWIPTEEEKDLITDSFELMPDDETAPSLRKIEIKGTPRPSTYQKTETQQKPVFKQQPRPATPPQQIKQKPIFQQPVPQPKKQTPPQQTYKPVYKPVKEEPLPPLEENEENETSFEIADKDFSEENIEQEQNQQEIKETEENEEPKQEENKKAETEEDDGMIVKADSDAIEQALKKYKDEKDDSMVEVDEKTIIDKVLKQKKKWKSQ